MSLPENVNEWNARIAAEFRANRGEVPSLGPAQPVVVLHTRGARSGRPRENPLVALVEDDTIYVFGSKGGGPSNPDWYHNVIANPRIEVEYGAERFPADAVELHGDERDRVYARQVAMQPQFGDYARATTRTIPVVALRRASE